MEVILHEAEAISYLKQLLYLQTSLKESENHCLEDERKESEGKNCRELLVAEVECLKEELVSYKAGKEGCWACRKKHS